MIYTKLAADGSDLPADATDHKAVRIEHSMLVLPIIVTAHSRAEGNAVESREGLG